MAASQSNLSDPKYAGYDMVVAVTQKSLNATLKQYLAGLTSPEVIFGYVFDDHNNLELHDYATLKANAKGSDPFAVANGADPATNQDLINLANSKFAGAVKATIGLPDAPLASIPPIVKLGLGAWAPAQFNLLCSEFVIVGFEYGAGGKASWINMSQPAASGQLWYFSAQVDLNKANVDRNSPVPPVVQQRIIQLQDDPANAFTIQKFFLDLETAILLPTPQIQGIPPEWAVWQQISTMFPATYFDQLRLTGNPVLNYSFTAASPRPATMLLGSVKRDCLPLLDNGQPIYNPTPAQLDATALAYLGSTTTTPPVPVPFGWNWVDLADVGNFSGIISVRRDVFFTYLTRLLNQNIASLCYETNVTIVGHNLNYKISPTFPLSSTPANFQPAAPNGKPDSSGFTNMGSCSYAHNSHGYDWTFESNINMDFNYSMDATVAVSSDKIRLVVHSKIFMSYSHLEFVATYNDLPGNFYFDKTLTTYFNLGVDQHGKVQVSEDKRIVDASVPWNFQRGGIMSALADPDAIKNSLTAFETALASNIDSAMSGYADGIAALINGYQGWVFPGNEAFTFRNVGFSANQDLIAQLTYVNPN